MQSWKEILGIGFYKSVTSGSSTALLLNVCTLKTSCSERRIHSAGYGDQTKGTKSLQMRERDWRTRGKREAGLCQEEEYSSDVKGVKKEKGVNEDAEGILVCPFSRY